MTVTEEREHGRPHRPRCDPELIDRRRCRAEGLKEEAAWNAAHEAELDAVQQAFRATETAYRQARQAARPTVSALRQQVAKVLDQLRCLIDDRRTVQRLDEAWRVIAERLADCGEEGGCRFDDDGDFGDVEDCRPDDIPARIAEIERRTAAAKAAFDLLTREPQELTAGVEAIRAELADIATKMGGDATTTDFKRLYARTLVAERRLAHVWRGFDHAHDFVECLCGAMTCVVEGHHAIGVLKRKQAVAACRQRAEDAACADLRANAVDKIMDEYARRLPRPRPGAAEAPADPTPPGSGPSSGSSPGSSSESSPASPPRPTSDPADDYDSWDDDGDGYGDRRRGRYPDGS